VTLDIEDQGRGLRDQVPQRHGTVLSEPIGVGIQGMRERIRQLGGTFDVAFTDSGTTVRVRVPVKEDVE
jgi:signal transduction histidine kinase